MLETGDNVHELEVMKYDRIFPGTLRFSSFPHLVLSASPPVRHAGHAVQCAVALCTLRRVSAEKALEY
jgi:hypothetical protein